MPRPKKVILKEEAKEVLEELKQQESEKESLLKLYQTLKDLNVRSISDLENLIARAE